MASRRPHPGARPARYEATDGPDGEPFAAPDDPLAQFLVERYRFYTEAPDGALRNTTVDHEPWTLYTAVADVETNALLSANGFRLPDAEPLCYYSPGLDVVAGRSRRWKDGAGRR